MLNVVVIYFLCLVYLESTDASLSNVTNSNDLPQIRDGYKCIYGKTYKMDCNICRCGHKNTLMCTKRDCLSDISKNIGRQAEKKNGKIRKNNKGKLVGSKFQRLPEGPCIPGKFYRKKCKMCFCTDKAVGVCGDKKDACRPAEHFIITKPDDVRPPIRDEEFKQLAVLANRASKCKPGKTYRVDCNPCLCKDNYNMLCDILMCIDFADMRRIAAKNRSGKPCNETEPPGRNCLTCTCKGKAAKARLQCKPIKDCFTDTERKLGLHTKMKSGSRVALNDKKDQCQPGFVYRDDCNTCYCPKNKGLICALIGCRMPTHLNPGI